jgi:biotin operon repressor
MMYVRSREIEFRHTEVLRLIRTGRFSTPGLAEKIGVSIPTISRCIESLRNRGYEIRSVRLRGTWRYILLDGPQSDRKIRVGTRREAHASQ